MSTFRKIPTPVTTGVVIYMGAVVLFKDEQGGHETTHGHQHEVVEQTVAFATGTAVQAVDSEARVSLPDDWRLTGG